ncbi:MAG: glycoside hydrolase superfamily [Monoraphidium minutum]|nr:MAG: glycoside hydrolase superfamily [Monoraphidium minutum]
MLAKSRASGSVNRLHMLPGRPRCSPIARVVNKNAENAADRSVAPALKVHYVRKDRSYKGWSLHTWGDAEHTNWQAPLAPTGFSPDGVPFWEVPLKAGATWAGVMARRGEEKAAAAEHIPLSQAGPSEVWLVGNEAGARDAPPDVAALPAGDLSKAYAHWVDTATIAWRIPTADGPDGPPRSFSLHFSPDASLRTTADGVAGAAATLPLRVAGAAVPPAVTARFPHLSGCTHLEVPEEHRARIPELLRGQVAVSAAAADGGALDACGVQLAGVLDDLFATDEPLGDHPGPQPGARAVSLWAPTAVSVQLLRWPAARGGEPEVHEMARGAKGVWSLERPAAWERTYYKYRLSVFCPWTNKIETSEVTDPYSRCTAANGERSMFLGDLDVSDLAPEGWPDHVMPRVGAWTDISVYELHIRDFSASDPTVPPHLRGKYRAFSPAHTAGGTAAAGGGAGGLTAGQAHLAALRAAGLTHVHLLPTYDYGSVPEREEEQMRVEEDLSQYPPDGEQQQAAVAAIADQDAFNWGYDPVHYGVPEGSYSTAPDGPLRVLEFREMVQALHGLGLRVVLDVVYNHTFASGPHTRHSVLDKAVPGYYHRRMEDGEMCHSTCCNNTASEHRMMLRLMVDDITHWARTYKVDGFRFDIMGHHMVEHMEAIRSALDRLTPGSDGVDGAGVYLYGEAWDFGEVALNARGRNASQLNMAGTRIGGFNDRMRDGAMGGSPFEAPDTQGFVTGLALDPNGAPHQGDAEQQLRTLLHRSDWVRAALAGNLGGYPLQLDDGRTLPGRKAAYHGTAPLAYGGDPCENIIYCGCHDNETVFDQVMLKAAAGAGAEERARMCRLAHALVLLSQGVPFVHAGDDLLRSKSLDRDSYNSGDHFNRVDWSGQCNNFGVGLPPASKNKHAWPLKRPLLAAAAAYKPPPVAIAASAAHFRALLRVRYSSPLFRLPAAADVMRQVAFENTGPGQLPGVIVMVLTSSDSPTDGTHDPAHARVVAVFNARPAPAALPFPAAAGAGLELHPALAELAASDAALAACCADGAARELHVAARTAAVFVERRAAGAAGGGA